MRLGARRVHVHGANEIVGNATYQGYGQTKLLPIAMMGSRQWFAKDGLRACGMPLSFAQLQIGGEDNKPVQCGKPARSSPRAKDDIGCLDANGSLFMLDRADDRVISNGRT